MLRGILWPNQHRTADIVLVDWWEKETYLGLGYTLVNMETAEVSVPAFEHGHFTGKIQETCINEALTHSLKGVWPGIHKVDVKKKNGLEYFEFKEI